MLLSVYTRYDDTPIFYLNGIPIYVDGNNWTDSYITLDIGISFSKYLQDGNSRCTVASETVKVEIPGWMQTNNKLTLICFAS